MRFIVRAVFVILLFNSCRKADLEPGNTFTSSGSSFSADSPMSAYTPDIDESGVDLETDIVLNVAMLSGQGAKISGVNFTVMQDSNHVDGSVIVDNSKATFRPSDDLLPHTKYAVHFSAEKEILVDRFHNIEHKIPLAYDWVFETGGPTAYKMEMRSDHVTQFNRDGLKVMQVGDSIFTYGGWQRVPESYNDVYMSNGDLTTWTKMPDAPWHRRHTFGIGKIDTTLYIFGGDTIHDTFDVWKSNDGINFSMVAPSLDGTVGNRILYGACVHNSKLFVLGGQSQVATGYGLSDVWSSSDGANWEKLSDGNSFLKGNISGSVASFNGQIWVIGGGYYEDPDPDKLYTSQVYSSRDGVSWIRHDDGPWSGRQYTDVVVWKNRLWMIGGFDWDNMSDIWYLTKAGTWVQYTPPPEFEGRHATGVAVYNDQLVIVCGNYHNDCWVIEKIKS